MTYDELIEKYTQKLKQCVVTECDKELLDEMCDKEMTLLNAWLKRLLMELYRKKRRPLPKTCPRNRTIEQIRTTMIEVICLWADEFGRDWLGQTQDLEALPEHVQWRTVELMFVAINVVLNQGSLKYWNDFEARCLARQRKHDGFRLRPCRLQMLEDKLEKNR